MELAAAGIVEEMSVLPLLVIKHRTNSRHLVIGLPGTATGMVDQGGWSVVYDSDDGC